MALMKCPECGHMVSTQAASCPSCGYPLKPESASGKGGALQSPKVWSTGLLALGAWLVTPWIARLIVAVIALVVAYFLFSGK